MLDLNYEQGLEKLKDIVHHQTPELLPDFSILEFRLIKCITKEHRYGQSSNDNVEQNQIIDQLIRFANEHFSIQFIDLCRSGTSSGQEVYDTNTGYYPNKYTIKNDGSTQGQVIGEHVSVSMNFGSSQKEYESPLRSSSNKQPPSLPLDIWTDESEVTVRGVRYSIHEQPVEVKWAPDRSALYQRARARQIGTDRIVWLKQVQLRQATPTAATWRTALEKESRLLDILEQGQRQGFPRLLDFEPETYVATLVHIATQGKSWEQFFGLSDEPLDAQRTRFLLRSAISLCEMLKALHNQQLTHRTLTPNGILLLDGHRAVLQDIGLAPCGYVPGEGPKLYRAPEQAISNRSLTGIGPHTDVYQLGIILYRLLTGSMPMSPSQVLPPSAWNNALSSELDAVLLRAIVHDVKKRWRTSYDFSSALRKALF